MTHEQNTARTVRILMEAATLAYLSGDDARGEELETQASELLVATDEAHASTPGPRTGFDMERERWFGMW